MNLLHRPAGRGATEVHADVPQQVRVLAPCRIHPHQRSPLQERGEGECPSEGIGGRQAKDGDVGRGARRCQVRERSAEAEEGDAGEGASRRQAGN